MRRRQIAHKLIAPHAIFNVLYNPYLPNRSRFMGSKSSCWAIHLTKRIKSLKKRPQRTNSKRRNYRLHFIYSDFKFNFNLSSRRNQNEKLLSQINFWCCCIRINNNNRGIVKTKKGISETIWESAGIRCHELFTSTWICESQQMFRHAHKNAELLHSGYKETAIRIA